jgi:hypothetical protein
MVRAITSRVGFLPRASSGGGEGGEDVTATDPWAAGLVLALLVPTPVEAYELSAGVSLGWLQAGTVPRLAVGPHAGIA